jgi:alpha-beta hydrolase superfamily lysophospholipase
MAGVGNTFFAASSSTAGCASERERVELYYESWLVDEKLCSETNDAFGRNAADIVFFHGVNESADTIMVQRLAQVFVERGLNFHVMEHHGHGRSVGSGTLGLVDSFDRLLADALSFCKHIVSRCQLASCIRRTY